MVVEPTGTTRDAHAPGGHRSHMNGRAPAGVHPAPRRERPQMTKTPTPRRPLQAVPPTQPVTGPTSTTKNVLAGLTARPNITAAELALAIGVGRSTATKALAALEHRGLAERAPGELHDGRRAPDRWRATTRQPAKGPGTAEAPDGSKATKRQQTAPGDTSSASTQAAAEDSNSPRSGRPSGEGARAADPLLAAAALPAARRRLRPGALRQQVLEHLQGHPQEAFTATKISRVIEKSSGAIANALVNLAGQGLAEKVSDKPRRYRSAAANAADRS